jgi:two-component system nitrate/nitrite sensor histidine kinase NarX
LSFLKIQIARFNHLIQKGAEKPKLEIVASELKEGISIAYQQLREVLTTFRLQAHEPGLEQALKSAISEYTQRGNLLINLDFQLNRLSPSANEEMHILQIIREALTNIVKHANASRVWINLSELKDSKIIIRVKDDGIGMIKMQSPFSHGMTIMNERASKLGGHCSIRSIPRPTQSHRGNCDLDADDTNEYGTSVEVICQIGHSGADFDTINPFAQ